MGTGYTRNDTSNNIADGNIINAADLDGEFDAIESAMGTSGHTHDGTSAEGGPVTVLGPVQDFVASATEIKPKTTNTLDIGTNSLLFKDMFLDGVATMGSIKIDNAGTIGSASDGDAIAISSGGVVSFSQNTIGKTGSGYVLALQTSDTTIEATNVLGKIEFSAPDEASGTDAILVGASIEALAEATFDSATNSTALVFKTNTTGAATERMRLTSAGDLHFLDNRKAIFGAGSDLEVFHDGSASNIIDTGTGNLFICGSGAIHLMNPAQTEYYASFNDNGAVDLRYDNSIKLATTSTGVDITGTITSDGLTFDVADFVNITAKESLAITIDSDNNQSSRNFTIFNDGTTQKLFRADDTGDISFYEDTGTTAKFFWDASAESLGIGNTNPDAIIRADSGTANKTLFKHNPPSNRYFSIAESSDGTYDNAITTFYKDATVGQFVFETAAAERMRIDSSGNVGIGTSSPSESLTNRGNIFIETNSTSADSGNGLFWQSTTSGWSTSTAHAAIYGKRTDASNGYLRFDTRQSGTTQEAMRIDSSGMLNAYYGISVDGGTIKLDGNYPVGTRNVALGDTALDSATTASDVVAIGNAALTANTSGEDQVAIGSFSLDANTTGNYNTAIGFASLSANTTASNNTAVGYQAGYSNTTGIDNTALGHVALPENTTGSYHVAIGRGALNVNTTGDQNTALGYYALGANTTSGYSTAVGSQTLRYNTGAENTAIGSLALFANTSGQYNSALGREALRSNTTASNNTALGYQAGYSNTTGTIITALGRQALYDNTTGTNNTAVGYAMVSNTTGSSNTGIGHNALHLNTTASYNTAVGYQAGYTNVTGSPITALGYRALYLNTASDNTAVGYSTLQQNSSGSANTGLGHMSLHNNTTASNNTAVGYQAGYTQTTNGDSTYVGYQAGYSRTGSGNTCIGNYSGRDGSTGTDNTLIGRNAGYTITTGSKNTIIGLYNGNQGGLDIRTSDNNIVLSDGDGNPRVIVDSSGNLLLGKTVSDGGIAGFEARPAGLVFSTISSGNTYFLHDTSVNKFYVNANGGIYNYQSNNVNLSDQRMKKNIEALGSQWAALKQWNLKKFHYNSDSDSDVKKVGVIAQDVQSNYPDLVTDFQNTEDEIRLAVKEQQMMWIAIKALQEAQDKIETLETENTSIKARITALENA